MLTLLVKQQPPKIATYSDPNILNVKRSIPTIPSYVYPDTIIVKANIAPILVYDNTYVEPFTYIDGGFYDATGTPVDALYYNTITWDVTWNGGYP